MQAAAWRSPDDLVADAARMLATDGLAGLAQFDSYPAPLYAVDADGTVAYFNDACVALAGRTPNVGIDRWCVCHVLRSSEGDLIDPEVGPMAAAVRGTRAVRGVESISERPDGDQARVRPYPTPALDEDGTLRGGVNLLVPLDGEVHYSLLDTARRCRTLAKWIGDLAAGEALLGMAGNCEAQAEVLRPS